MIEPSVHLLGHTQCFLPRGWMHDMGMDIDQRTEFLSTIPDISDPEFLVLLAAKRCYKSFVPGLNPNVTKVRDDPKEYFANILRSGHGSVLEHASATFAFENVSRVFTHELVRHRVGSAYSQESGRYVRPTKLEMWRPECIPHECWEEMKANVQKVFDKYLSDTNEMDRRDLPFSEKKILTSALRRMLPEGMPTGIVATFNFRTLRHLIRLRTNAHAEAEIRQVFATVAKICFKNWPLVFQDMRETSDGSYYFEYDA